MPVKLSDMVNKQATTEVVFGEFTVNIVFYPNKVNEETIFILNELTDGDSTTLKANFQKYNETFSELIVSWDLVEDDGVTPITIDAAHFVGLPIEFRGALVQTILGYMRPNSPTTQTA